MVKGAVNNWVSKCVARMIVATRVSSMGIEVMHQLFLLLEYKAEDC